MLGNQKEKYPDDAQLSLGRQALLFFWEVTKVVVIAVAIIVPVRYFLIKPFYVKGASMEPNFYDREYLIIDEISYRFSQPDRGEIVVFRYPGDPAQFFIKRVIGLPNEQIRIDDNTVTIYSDTYPNGVILDEPYLDSAALTRGRGVLIDLSPNEYYVMGDNRDSSLDSRVFGPVERDAIVGRALLRGWPLNRAGLLTEGVDYNL